MRAFLVLRFRNVVIKHFRERHCRCQWSAHISNGEILRSCFYKVWSDETSAQRWRIAVAIKIGFWLDTAKNISHAHIGRGLRRTRVEFVSPVRRSVGVISTLAAENKIVSSLINRFASWGHRHRGYSLTLASMARNILSAKPLYNELHGSNFWVSCHQRSPNPGATEREKWVT